MKMNLKKKNTKKGFTMVETLVAIFILLVTTTGPLTFAQSGLRASFLARDQVVAYYLAQDSIETIKSMRDNNSLKGRNWLYYFDDCKGDEGCRMETSPNFETEQCTSKTTCEPMFFDEENKTFVLSSSETSSRFTRRIFVNEIIPNQEAQIVVVVEWDTNFFAQKSITVQENIYNWVPAYTSL